MEARLASVLNHRRSGGIAVALLLLAVALALILHALHPELHPARAYVSEYANGRWGWVLTLTLLAFASGAYALGRGLRQSAGQRLGPALITAAGACMAVAALVSTDRYGDEEVIGTFAGRLHGYAAITGFAILVLAMLLLARPLEREPRWGRVGRITLPLAAVSVFALAGTFAAAPEAAGLRQRVFLLPVIGWLVASALKLRALEEERDTVALPRVELGA